MARHLGVFGVAFFAIFGFSGAIAQPDSYCSSYASQMAPDTLYIAKACPDDAETRCLVPVPSSGPIQEGILYHFLYMTPRTDIQNSLIVIQVKGIAAQPVPSPASVRLTRHQFSFACRSKANIFPRSSFRDEVNNDPATQNIAYDSYDRFNRYGYAPQPARGILVKFHTNYFNGSECVSTLETVRRAQFLFTDRDKVPGLWVALATELHLQAPVAVAEDINRYDHLHVIVTNYKKQPQASGCVSFVARSHGPSLEIDLSDLEEKARELDPIAKFTPRVWVLNSQ
jgi:hypothetical protein